MGDNKSIDMQQEEVVERIKAFAQRVLPEDSSLWLYGSRARGDAHPDSDYDLLCCLIRSASLTRIMNVMYITFF